jgi:hypothetical protein
LKIKREKGEIKNEKPSGRKEAKEWPVRKITADQGNLVLARPHPSPLPQEREKLSGLNY